MVMSSDWEWYCLCWIVLEKMPMNLQLWWRAIDGGGWLAGMRDMNIFVYGSRQGTREWEKQRKQDTQSIQRKQVRWDAVQAEKINIQGIHARHDMHVTIEFGCVFSCISAVLSRLFWIHVSVNSIKLRLWKHAMMEQASEHCTMMVISKALARHWLNLL